MFHGAEKELIEVFRDRRVCRENMFMENRIKSRHCFAKQYQNCSAEFI